MSDQVIDLGTPSPDAVQFYILRSSAIDAYSGMEQSLSHLLSLLLGNDYRAASTIFNRLSNTKSRNLIIEDLLKQRFGDTYSAYWHGIPQTANKRGLMNIIQDLDGVRNNIVHWVVVRNVGDGSDFLTLAPAGFKATTSINSDALRGFVAKADFAARAITMFHVTNGVQAEHLGADLATWREIHQQPCVYPPPDSHPLSRNYKAPQTPPQASGA